MAISLRTEKAIKKVIELKGKAVGIVDFKKTGDGTITIYRQEDSVVVAKFTLKSLIKKRLPKRKTAKI